MKILETTILANDCINIKTDERIPLAYKDKLITDKNETLDFCWYSTQGDIVVQTKLKEISGKEIIVIGSDII